MLHIAVNMLTLEEVGPFLDVHAAQAFVDGKRIEFYSISRNWMRSFHWRVAPDTQAIGYKKNRNGDYMPALMAKSSIQGCGS